MGSPSDQGIPLSSYEKQLYALQGEVNALSQSVDRHAYSPTAPVEASLNLWPLALIVVVGLAAYLLVRYFHRQDPILAGLERCLVGLSVVTAATTLLITIDEQWYWFSDKPAPAVALLALPEVGSPQMPLPLHFIRPLNPESATDPIARFMVPFVEATCSSADDPLNWQGVTTTPRFENYLRALGKNLAACASDIAPVVVHVKGFASSSEVKNADQCQGAQSSDAANLTIAHARRDRVIRLLATHAGRWVDIQAHTWTDSAAMKHARQFNDRTLDKQYSVARGSFNRRVDIEFWQIGLCHMAEGNLSVKSG